MACWCPGPTDAPNHLNVKFLTQKHYASCQFRLFRGPDIKKDAANYVARARKRMALDAAALAWKNGVPWAEALGIANNALSSASAKAKAVPRGPRARRMG